MKLKACHLSDTHDVYVDLKKLIPSDTDIVFITGDMTYKGHNWELKLFLDQMRDLKKYFKHIVVIPGNHEVGCEKNEKMWRWLFKRIGAHFLVHESVVIEGINIFGSAWTPWFLDWAYNIPRGEERKYWEKIPSNTQVLLTHGPPYEILDSCRNGNVGCPELRKKVLNELPFLKYHLFGHIHESKGTLCQNGIFFSNASIMDGKYRFVNGANIFEINL